jgi:ComF family protein
MSLLSWIKNAFLDFLFPKTNKILHLESLSTEKLLQILPQSEHDLDKETLALFSYQNSLVKEIIWEVKYNGNRRLANTLGAILYDTIETELMERNVFEKYHNVILLPMPTSDKRRFERGWNQCELLTEAIKHLDISQHLKYLPRQLAKVVHTESQTKTGSRSERLANLKETMRVLNPLSVQDKYVVLVDDVTTTGATFAEAKRALKEANAKKILCVALAH